ncbi:MAG: hypothetical protein RI947_1560 [Candidatus Parcubacteria bacterium]|jgi:UDP-N-acetylmuramoylalanine--D-glutamate ligase
MKIQELKNKHIVILGYGAEGKSAETYIRAHFPDAHITIGDQANNPHYLALQEQADVVIKSPGIPARLVTVPYTTPTNMFFANADAEIIGVTGTKGKSTTTSLIYDILKEADKPVRIAGNIGIPLLTELLQRQGQETLYVCELSSYQLENLQYSPHISVVLNVFPEHMPHHGDVHRYYAAKKNIISHAKTDDYYIYNPAFPLLVTWAKEAACKTVPYTDDVPVYPDEVALQGAHNMDNIRAAVTVARLYNIHKEAIRKALKAFKPLPHRMELVGEHNNIRFYDDAISTTPQSTIKAIETLKQIGTLFLGGTDRGYDFSELAETIQAYEIPNIVLFPDSGKQILKTLQSKLHMLPHILETSRMEEAVKFAYEHTPAGSICLLSCASPSYSLWKNFEEKGNEFRRYADMYSK